MFLDESGFLLVPNIAKTWAPRGQTPIVRVAGNWTKISAISAVTVSPKRKRTALYIRFHTNKNVRTLQVRQFLQALARHIQGPIILLWDRSQTHRSKLVQAFLRRHPRIHPHFFPGYAPELNPDEFVWSQLKRSLSNLVPKDIKHLKSFLWARARKLQSSQRNLWSCIHASDLPW